MSSQCSGCDGSGVIYRNVVPCTCNPEKELGDHYKACDKCTKSPGWQIISVPEGRPCIHCQETAPKVAAPPQKEKKGGEKRKVLAHSEIDAEDADCSQGPKKAPRNGTH